MMDPPQPRTGSPLATVIIPTYNRAAFVRRAIESALAQTYHPLEVIVVDNASTDETRTVMQSFVDPRLHYERQAAMVTMAQNFKRGLERARGEFVAFLPDDDRMMPTFVGNRVGEFVRHPRAIAVFSGFRICDEHSRLVRTVEPRLPVGVDLDPSVALRAALSREWSLNSSMYRRQAVEAVWPLLEGSDNAFDTGMHIHFGIARSGTVVYGPWADFLYTHHSSQTSRGAGKLAHYAAGARMYEGVLKRDMPRAFRNAIERDYSAWQVAWGRALAGERRLAEARAAFIRAIRVDATFRGGWTQLAMSVLNPRRVVGTE